MRKTLWLLLTTLLAVSSAGGTNADPVTIAEFSSLQAGNDPPPGWESVTVAAIPRHTQYTLTMLDGLTVLRAEADASMSSLVRAVDIDPHATPWLHWRWRISALNDQSGLRSKQRDDFPARVYVLFDYDIMQLPLHKRVLIRIARAVYGDHLPLAALCYVWSTDEPPGTTAPSAYTDRVHMVVATSGADHVDQWVSVERNVMDDYRNAFGEPVPRITGIAIATDSDQSGAYSLAWYGDMSLSSQPQSTQ